MVIKSFLWVLIKAQMLSAHNWTALHSSYAAYIIKGKVAFHEFTPAELCGSNFSPMRTENCIPGTATPAAHCTRRNALPLYVCVYMQPSADRMEFRPHLALSGSQSVRENTSSLVGLLWSHFETSRE